MPNKVITKDGFELHWSVNYFAPYLLTNLLLVPPKNAQQARIVNLVTNIAFVDKIDFNDIETKPDFGTNEPFVESKLSLSMFSIELAEQLKNEGITINYLHPGNIKSSLL